jgi:hypothetical protein
MISGKPIPKQRGIYSEILTTSDKFNVKVSIIKANNTLVKEVSTCGPDASLIQTLNPRQKMGRAKGKFSEK